MMEQETDQAAQLTRHHVDWRTGKTMVERDDVSWHEHERQRVESGDERAAVLPANELALSTYRHRISSRRRGGSAGVTVATAKKSASFVALTAPVAPKTPEMSASMKIALQGMTVRLRGEAAERVLQRVMARLA